jgi:hypothetical protein
MESPAITAPRKKASMRCSRPFFHQGWYATVLLKKAKPVVSMQWINFDYMRKKKDATFNRILEACDFHGTTHIMQFQYNWNKEIIAEF